MGALFAIPAVGTEAGEKVLTHLFPNMFLGAAGAEGTEAAIVVWTGRQLALGVDMKVQTFVAVAAETVPQEEVALWHLAQVELV